MEDAVRKCILQADKDFLEHAVSAELADGTTATVAIVKDKELLVANVGDSEAVLAARDGELKAISMSNIHCVKENPDEVERVKAAGGLIYRNRVGHPALNPAYFSIGVSRAIGDLMFKHPHYTDSKESGIIADPEFKQVVLEEDKHSFLILACDGLWGSMNHQQAVDIVGACLAERADDADAAAAALVDKALEEGSLDNVTAMVIIFKW